MAKTSEERGDKKNVKKTEPSEGGTHEREDLPVKLVNIKALRAIFEQSSSTKDDHQNRSRSSVKTTRSGGTGSSGIRSDDTSSSSTTLCELQENVDNSEKDMVDCSQPSMTEVLRMFRRLEDEDTQMKRPNARMIDGMPKRSSSLGRSSKLTYERKVTEPSRSTLSRNVSFEERLQAAKPSSDRERTGYKSSNVKKSNQPSSPTEISSADRSNKSSKYLDENDVHEMNTVKTEEEAEGLDNLPAEGTVQSLLKQWRNLEGTDSQKMKTDKTDKKKVRFGVDSSWLFNDSSLPESKKIPQKMKSCLKTTKMLPRKDKNFIINGHSVNGNWNHGDEMDGSLSPSSPTTSRKSLVREFNHPPPDVISQISSKQEENDQMDELPPASNTKNLLEKFKALQVRS